MPSTWQTAKKPHPTLSRCTGRGEKAFTLVELCIGLVVTAMVGGALATFTMAVGSYWRQSSNTQTAALSANQLSARLQKGISDAKRIGSWRGGGGSGSAGVIYWIRDANGDGLMQTNEMAGVHHNPSTKRIVLYSSASAPVEGNLQGQVVEGVQDGGQSGSGAQSSPGGDGLTVAMPVAADHVWTRDEFLADNAIDVFAGSVGFKPLVNNVQSATLAVQQSASTTVAPTLRWSLQIVDADGTTTNQTIAASLRGPSTPP